MTIKVAVKKPKKKIKIWKMNLDRLRWMMKKKTKMMELVRLKPRSRGKKGPRPLSSASKQSYSL